MKHPVLVDTGPLVALLSKRDEFHQDCIECLKNLSPPLVTCWPVITEAHWLVHTNTRANEALFALLRSPIISIEELNKGSVEWIAAFLSRYRTVKAQVADAALCYLAEEKGLTTIFTLDRKDFSVYRVGRKRTLNIVP